MEGMQVMGDCVCGQCIVCLVQVLFISVIVACCEHWLNPTFFCLLLLRRVFCWCAGEYLQRAGGVIVESD